MVVLNEYLEKHTDDISCIPGCGKCCPPVCKQKTEDALCAIHPTRTGIENDIRRIFCTIPPVTVVRKTTAACPPVMDVIQEKTGIRPRVIDREEIYFTSLRSGGSFTVPSGTKLDEGHLSQLMKMEVKE